MIPDDMLDCTGDAVRGDVIQFAEAVWGGSRRKPKKLGVRTITAEVVKESYGATTQQHTFTLLVLSCEGYDPLAVGRKVLRKGRNVYRDGTLRRHWEDEEARKLVADEKHARGDLARAERECRRALSWCW